MSLSKADQDVREFLCLADPVPRISGMLDWERVSYGDPRYEVMALCLRLHLMECGELWPSLREGYERESGERMHRTAGAMSYLIQRTIGSVSAGPRPDISVRLLEGILRDELVLFADDA